MMKFEFKNQNDDDVIETVKFSRKELRAIAAMASYYANTDAELDVALAARRLEKAIDKCDYGDWSKLFVKNHD
jgi:hypothetical protein